MTGKSATKIVPSSIRRLTDKGSSTATRILEEAKNILVEDGFLGLSFRAIAKRTGTTVGNIGYYYGTKDDLMVDLAEYIFDRWEFRLQRDMPPSMTDRREKFRYFIRYMIDQNKQRKTMFLLLEMWAMANRSLAVSKMMDTFYGRLRGSIRVDATSSHQAIEVAALASPEFLRFADGRPIRKVIVVPGRLVNIVV